tara:strand:- start:5570 stop:6139 length:570 start_codon:yes stop_codon:yes gene_type:complete
LDGRTRSSKLKMAKLRKSSAYSKRYARPFTRVSKKRTKSYIKTSPQLKLVKFNMGNSKAFNEGKFDTWVHLISKEPVQIRDNALEAIRQSITRRLEKNIQGQFYFEISVFPHHILRENKMLTGAGSDRMQTGMQKSFGKNIGRAALIKENQILAKIATSGDNNIRLVKTCFKAVKPKLPCKVKISIEKI